jgi:hypothetical protein
MGFIYAVFLSQHLVYDVQVHVNVC